MLETQQAIIGQYATFPVKPVSGRGSWLIDEEGNEWLDAYGGHAVSSTGHSHPAVVKAIAEQAARLLFYSTAVPHPNRERLAEELARRCPDPLNRVFFCNSGAEANENAIALARKHTSRRKLVSLEGGWHGRTIACGSVTDGAKYQDNAVRAGLELSAKIPFNDVAAVDRIITTEIAGVIVEPVQGMMGARDCSPEFLRSIRERCNAVGAMLIFDEVQSGVGRSGDFTAAQTFGVTPDLLTLAKGLASGIPIGAVMISDAIAAGIKPGELGSTFGGGPVPCAAALATLDVMDTERLEANARAVGEHLAGAALGINGVVSTQGKGLLLGLRLDRPAALVQKALFDKRILVGTSTDPDVLRLIPPLSFSLLEADLLLNALAEVMG
jgi:acetylornithine/succinyldiaminopimelate/putrescine aminotransferase